MKRLLMLFIPIFILLSGCQLIEESEYTCRIHFIDTGKSDCILIESDKNVLIDAGDNDHQYEVVDYINKLGIKKLDYVVNTHPDADHCGGMDKIVEYFDIGQVFVGNGNSDKKTYKKFIEALADKKLNPSVPLEQSILEIGEDTTIQFFNSRNTSEDTNETSLVVLLSCENKKALFTGDITSDVEKDLLEYFPKVDILKVAHHGSSHSTSNELLEKIQPKYAIICTGKNEYGHPTKQTLYRLEKCGAKIYRTDEDGSIIVSIGNKSIWIETKKRGK